ncbi:MAG: hypothetical protein Q8O42_02910 [Acidobacteriota bacterium]|nr:hypothetical protein [Acidobacteriota bacterium]
MISRREVVTAGVLGTLATGAAPSPAEAVQDGPAILAGLNQVRAGLNQITEELEQLRSTARTAFLGTTMSGPHLGLLNQRIELHLKSSGKFPEFCDIGTSVFYEVYDWHVKHQQQINVTRFADQRLMIRFMFTQLVLRWENESGYIGLPYDK